MSERKETIVPKQYVSKAVGIDLGTTNSVVAMMSPTDTEIILHKEGRRETTPSCVWKDPRSGEIIVGSKAFARIGHKPAPVRSIKRSMGRQTKVQLTDEALTPEEISAHILREMKRQIETDVASLHTHNSAWFVDRAIITVPAYFELPQIEATRKAGELANLEVLQLLHEPTAAACYHCWRTGVQNGLFLVYDFGGGTFDVSVLRCTEGAFQVLGISGNTWLGGDDIDTALAEYLRQQLQKEGWSLELDIKNNEDDRLRFDILKLLMEGVKKTLSLQDEVVLRDAMSLIDKAGERVDIELPFPRLEIEELMRPIIARTLPPCFEALELAQKKAEVTLADVDAIILAGGSTHIPLVREMVRQTLCADPTASGPRARCAEPFYEKVDSIVALGAAVQAASVGGLAVYNPQRSIRVLFNGTATTSMTKMHVGGRVEALTPDVDLKNGMVSLNISGLDFEDAEELNKNGAFAFKNIPLQTASENLLSFEIFDKYERPVMQVERAVVQNAEYRTIKPPQPPLPKSVLLKVNWKGNIHLETLCEAMTSLPASADFEFSHPGETEVVRFELFQGKRKIYELPVRVARNLPKGVPIHVNLYIDEMAFITVKGTIGEHPFDFSVENPPDRALPDADEIAAVEQKLQDALAVLPFDQRSQIEERRQMLKKNFYAAVTRGEEAQAVHEFEELEWLADEISYPVRSSLYPPKQEFDDLVLFCQELNRRAARQAEANKSPYDFEGIAQDIEYQRQAGEDAIAAGDQRSYSKAFETLESHRDYAADVAFRDVRLLPVEQRASLLLEYVLTEAARLEDATRAYRRPDLQKQTEQIRREGEMLRAQIEQDPLRVQDRARALALHLDRIRKLLMDTGWSDDGDIPLLTR
jgi:molecular chaperone DnaK